ncbi:acyl-CoA dehydrogenase family protein [Chloroflexota bacterium]
MNFGLSEEQKLLQKTAHDFLENKCPKSLVRELEASESGYSPEIWKSMADMGWLGLIFPEKYGGAGGSLIDLAVLFEEFGKAVFPSPMFSTVVLGALPILEAGNEQQKTELLPKVAKGEILLTLALTEPGAERDPKAISTRALPEQNGFSINGTKLFIQNAHIADLMLVVARTGKVSNGNGLTAFIVEGKAPGIGLTPLVTIGGDKQFEVTFNNVSSSNSDIVGELDAGWPLMTSMLQKATAIQCAETVGVMQAALDMSAKYASGRIQWGRPIGSFQAIQHRLADMLIDTDGARLTAYQAAWKISKGLPATREVAFAKAWISEACQRVAFSAQQVHGGLGVDIDSDLHFYFRRAKALELNLGSAPFHYKTVEAELGVGHVVADMSPAGKKRDK